MFSSDVENKRSCEETLHSCARPGMREVTAAHVARVLAQNNVKGDAEAWLQLANRILRGWEGLHDAKFPDGRDTADVGHRLALSVSAEWEAIGGDAAFKGPRRRTSRRTLSVLAQCLGLPRKWRMSHSQECRIRQRAHQHVSVAGTMFDPTKHRYAVYANVLSAEQVQNVRGLPERIQAASCAVRAGTGAGWVGVLNNCGAQEEQSGRIKWYCGGKDVIGFDCVRLLEEKGVLGEGYSAGTQQHTASIIYTKRSKGSLGEKRQQWHTDFDPEARDGERHLSVIFALDDDITLPVIGDTSLEEPLPSHNRLSEPTLNVHVPKGGCIILRGDTIHAGMHDKGRALRCLQLHLAKGTAAYVNEVVDNRLHFIE